MIPCRGRPLTSSAQLRENPSKPMLFEPGISLWKVWRERLSCQMGLRRARGRPSSGTSPRGGVVALVGAALRLGDDPVDDAELETVRCIRLECRCGLLRLGGIAPEDR